MENEHEVSIVINVYNEEENIEECLDSLLNQTFTDFELIIVDDGSTDDTMELVERYKEKIDLKTFYTPHVGIKKARRKGVSETTGDIIVVIDADEILENDFLEKIVEPFEDEKVGAVGGILRSKGEGWVTEAYGTLNELFYKMRSEGEEVDWIQGGCSAYRKEALEDVGGLAREKVSADKDISWKMKDEGWKVLLKEDAVAEHRDPQTLKSVMKREYNIGKRENSLLKKHRNRLSWKELSRFYPLAGFIFLLSVAFYPPLLLLFLLGVILTMIGVSYLLHKNIERNNFGISFKSWVILTIINLAWSLGYLRAYFEE